jgi:DnaK suppressor protein
VASEPSSKASTGTADDTGVPVLSDEDPWTTEELAAVRSELVGDNVRLAAELAEVEHDLVTLMRESGEGSGDDQADAGAATWEREHEMSLANNARALMQQTEHAIERIDEGDYGVCESCGRAIGKLRLQAFPRATLCLPCKQRQERR